MNSTVFDNRRVRSWGAQILPQGGVAALLLWLLHNTVANFDARGISVGFGFLSRPFQDGNVNRAGFAGDCLV